MEDSEASYIREENGISHIREKAEQFMQPYIKEYATA
jgi:hypothetical protein